MTSKYTVLVNPTGNTIPATVLSCSREVGDIPGCIPAPRDPTWMDEQKKCSDPLGALYCLAIENFVTGNYRGRFGLFSKYWDSVKLDNGIQQRYPGTA